MIHLTPFALSGLLAGIFSLAFGLFVFLKSHDRRLRTVWFLFALSAAGWGFGGFWIGMTQSFESAMLAYWVAYVLGVIWIAPLFYHFIHIFLEIDNKLFKAHYLVALVFVLFVLTGSFFLEHWTIVRDFRIPQGGVVFDFFFVWWMGLILYSHLQLIRSYNSVSPNKKQQIKYFFLATSVGFTGGSLCYVPMFGIPLYPWGNFTVFLYPIIMSYAMLKYQLMEVRLFLKRAALLIGVYVGLMILGFPLMAFLHSLTMSTQRVSQTWLSMEVAVMALLLSFGPFLYAYLVRSRSYFKEHTMAGLTHELKSPLATMDNALDIFSKRIANKMDREDLEYLAMLKNNQRRLSNSVNDLLCVYKVDGNSSLIIAEIDPAELVNSVEESFDSLLKLKNIAIHKNISTQQPKFHGDREKLLQILGNIVSNALKFSDTGLITITVRSRNNQIEFSVQDTGAGIARQELPYVFDRFYQGKMKQKNQGTGIGLTIAKTWVEAHSGKIWAESDGEGKGATVTFTLPV